MDRHGVSLTIDLLLARPVKVKLLERICLPANGYGTPWIVIDNNRMSVIDDAQPGRLVLEADRRQVDLMWITDVYGGLVMPTLAQSKLWVEITPMAGTVSVAVVPSVLTVFLGRAENGQSNTPCDCEQKSLSANLHIRSK
jgi:hypothetical protein